MDIGLDRQAPQKLRETLLDVRCVEREQLLELIHDDEPVLELLSPGTKQRDGNVQLLEAEELLRHIRVFAIARAPKPARDS